MKFNLLIILIVLCFLSILPTEGLTQTIELSNIPASIYDRYNADYISIIERKQFIRDLCGYKDIMDTIIEHQEEMSAEVVKCAKEFSDVTEELCECISINSNIEQCIKDTDAFISMLEEALRILNEYDF